LTQAILGTLHAFNYPPAANFEVLKYKFQTSETKRRGFVWVIPILGFEFVSDFDIRISDFPEGIQLLRRQANGEVVMDPNRKDTAKIEAKLGLWDAVSIVVGIIIGVGIFATPASIFEKVPNVWAGMGVWALGGILALLGALCFAELATAYPRSGGEYVYLTRAFGPLTGYLFAWAQLTIIRPGSIGAVAYVFAVNADAVFDLNGDGVFVMACGSIVVLTAINVLGVVLGAWTQNLLTLAKVLGLVALVVVGLAYGSPEHLADNPTPSPTPWLATVMIAVLWTYSGWQEASYVVSEVKDRQRNIPRALLLGTLAVTVIYLLVNAAYLYGLGFPAIQVAGKRVAADMLGLALPGYGARAMAILVVVCALGALNGMIFTTARIYAVFGMDHRLFAPLSHWSRRFGTPARALIVQGILNLLVVCGVLLYVWWHGVNGEDAFDTMLAFTAAVFWFFFLLTGAALFVLRHLDAELPRPFRVPLYPYVPLAFCGWSAYMTIMVVLALPDVSLVGLGVLLVGLPFYFWPQKRRREPAAAELEPVAH
jgi:amino acid transporter